jgi:branched-chain amino acid transport system permease protein
MKRLACIALPLGAVALIVLPLGLKSYGIYALTYWAISTIAAHGLNLTLGYAGQISLAQGAFVGIGAYTTALLTTHGVPFGAALIASFLLCLAIGWLLGYPALRVQSHYLAFVTLAFGTLAWLVFRNEEWLTGGVYGISDIPRPSLFGFSTDNAVHFYWFSLAILALVSFAMWWLVRSPWGRAFMALRENPVRAMSLGVDTRRYTLMAFSIGAGLGGISGSLFAPLVQYVDPAPFTLVLSFNLLLMVIVGGQGFFAGPFLGAIVAILLPEWLRFTGNAYLLIYAGLVMVMMVFAPTGLLGLLKHLTARRAPTALPAGRLQGSGP